MSTTAPVAGTLEAVNAAPDFDSAANDLLGYDPQAGDVPAEQKAKTEEVKTDGTQDTTQDAGKTDGADGTKTAEAAKTEAAQVDEWAIDQALLEKLLADPTHGVFAKELNEKYQKLLEVRKQYGEHWTIDEAREARALAPGGLEELKGVVQAGREAKAENAEFASGDPTRQAVVLQNLAKDMPQAYAAGAKPFLDTLKTASPDTYRTLMIEGAREALKADGVPDVMAAMFAAADKDDEAGFKDAFAKLFDWYGKANFGESKAGATKQAEQKLSPEIQKALEENKRYKENEAKQIAEGFSRWKKSVDEGFNKSFREEAIKGVENVLPKNMPAAAREQLASRLTNEILAEVDKRLSADTDLGGKMLAVIANNAWKDKAAETTTQAQNLLLGRAKQLLPYVAREILNPFTEAQVAKAAEKNEREKSASMKTEVRGGTGNANGSKPQLTREDMKGGGKGKRMSDEDILDL
jgi:hypothetical protein